jgi:glycosyltransferase involved in cell wall biosynthesis
LSSPPFAPPQVAIIVPTLREAANLPLLAERLRAALGTTSYELIIVDDDSRDGTEAVCTELARTMPLRLIVRRPPKDGLSGAVLEGFRHTSAVRLVVMDADLQHPPEDVPRLLALLDSGAPFVLGSRYTTGGSIEGRWSPFRRANSLIATLLARPFAPGITDPMSGFFALPRSTLDRAEFLTPLGYKIALELICKCRVAELGRAAELPITFAQRQHGESKLSLREQFRYLEHLSRLYDYTFPRASPVAKFLISVALGWAPAAAVFFSLLSQVHPRTATAWAYPLTVLVTAVLHFRYVRAQREFIRRPHPWSDFWLIAAAEYLTALLVAWYLSARIPDASGLELFVLPFALAAATRYALRKELLHDLRGLRRDPRRDL